MSGETRQNSADCGTGCECYDQPGQNCFTAGAQVIAAEGVCGPCAMRLMASALCVADELDAWDGDASPVLGGVSPGGAVRYALLEVVGERLIEDHYTSDTTPGDGAP